MTLSRVNLRAYRNHATGIGGTEVTCTILLPIACTSLSRFNEKLPRGNDLVCYGNVLQSRGNDSKKGEIQ